MIFEKTISMRLASLLTILVLFAQLAMPIPAVFAEEAPAETPAETPTEAAAPDPEPTPEPTPEPEPTPQPEQTSSVAENTAEVPPAEGGSTEQAAQTETNSESGATGGEADATGGQGGSGGDGGTGENGGGGGDGATGGDATADGGQSEATGGGGGNGGTGGDATGGEAGSGGEGAPGGDANAEGSGAEESTAEATGGNGGSGGGGGSGTGGASDGGIGGDAGEGGDANADAAGTDPLAQATGGEGGMGGDGGDGGHATSALDQTGGATTTAPETGARIVTGRSSAFGYLMSFFNIVIANSTGDILFLRNPLGEALNFTQRIIDLFSGLAVQAACTFTECESNDADIQMYTDNQVEISNTLVVSSLSGENRAYSEGGSADVSTGDARAYGGIVNFGNLQIVDSRYLILLVNNEGDLSGDILLPDGSFFKSLSSGAYIGRDSTLNVTNDAGILNNGTTTALSGDNTALSEEGSVINTGDSRAKTTVANFVNQIGAPICFVVSVGGAWNGGVFQLPEGFSHEKTTFGDLICGAGGGENRGDAMNGFTASTTNYARVLNEAIVEATTGANHAEGAAASITTGNADAFLSILNVVNQTIIGQDWIFAMFNVAGNWDGDLVFGVKPGEPDILGDITEQIVGSSFNGGGGSSSGGKKPRITLTKTASVVATTTPAQVEYTIVVDNAGGEAHEVVVKDALKGPDGSVIGTQQWNLGTLKAKEKITITYTVEFKGDLDPGYYTNTALLEGLRSAGTPLSKIADENVIEILPLGAVPGPQCAPLLTEFIKPYMRNTPAQVALLQTFLNDSEGETLEVNGIYDAPTIAAVHRFQNKYATDILAPWGISRSTGNVYYTTQKHINDLYCKGAAQFELTTEQLLEISRFKSQTTPNMDVGLMKKNEIGKLLKPTAKGPFLMPPPAMPTIFAPVSGETPAEPVSFIKLPLSLISGWLLSALPTVEASTQ